MAKSTEKILSRKGTGTFCGIAFHQHGRNFHLSVVPKAKTRNLTQEQCDDQTRFILATFWAIKILGDSKKCARFVNKSARTGRAPFFTVVNDCLKKLKKIDVSQKESV